MTAEAGPGRPRHRRSRWWCYPVGAVAILCAVWAVEWTVLSLRIRDETALTHLAALRSEILLDPETLRASPPDRDFDVAADGTVLFSVGGRLREVAAEGGDVAELPLSSTLDAFAFDRGGALLTIADGFLGRIDAQGRIVSGVPLPGGETRLWPSRHPAAVYLLASQGEGARLYRFFEDGGFQVLLESQRPLVAVADDREHVYAATATEIVRLDAKRPERIFAIDDAADRAPIVSLAAGDDGTLVFSTADRIYALRDGIAVSIVNDSGGALRSRGDRLYVLDGRRHLLYALSPLSADMFREAR
jgi:hypothetical protein